MAALDGVLGRSCAEHTFTPCVFAQLALRASQRLEFGRESVYESIEKE
jgi:hypothetical protein